MKTMDVPAERATEQAGAAPWPVMVLAYNEERHITGYLDSIFSADPGARFEAFVMANGCTDRTEAIVREYGARRAEVHLVSIAMGDKCNAWNVFIGETGPTCCPGRRRGNADHERQYFRPGLRRRRIDTNKGQLQAFYEKIERELAAVLRAPIILDDHNRVDRKHAAAAA